VTLRIGQGYGTGTEEGARGPKREGQRPGPPKTTTCIHTCTQMYIFQCKIYIRQEHKQWAPKNGNNNGCTLKKHNHDSKTALGIFKII